MKLTSKSVILIAAILLAACQNMSNEQQGGIMGAAGGGALGGLIGNMFGSGSGKAVATGVGAGVGMLAGYFAGSAIGRRLDQADQQKAAAATEKVLNKPIHHNSQGQAVSTASTWSDETKGTHGKSEVTSVTPQADGGECRNVHEIAYISGEEVSQNTKYCRSASGQWEKAGVGSALLENHLRRAA
jgi:surface antigen